MSNYQQCNLNQVLRFIEKHELSQNNKYVPLSKSTLDFFSGGYLPTEEEITKGINSSIRYSSDRITMVIARDWKPF